MKELKNNLEERFIELRNENSKYSIKILELEQELQKTREQLNTCEKLLMRFVPDEKTIQWQQRELDARQYFKDKQGE